MADLPTKPKCFVLSPTGEDGSPERLAADKVLRHLIKKALGDTFDVSRADDDANPGAITPRMVSSILEADLIVADLSGFNANVFYELAIAHGYGKPTVHLQRSGERPPFDVKDMRVVPYDTADPDELEAAQKKLRKYADFASVNPTLETPLSAGARFRAVAGSTDPVAESNVQVMNAINELAADVRRAIVLRPQRQTSVAGDIEATQRLLLNLVASGRIRDDDLIGTITADTSSAFDEMMRLVAMTIESPERSRVERIRLLYSDGLMSPEEFYKLDPDALDYSLPKRLDRRVPEPVHPDFPKPRSS